MNNATALAPKQALTSMQAIFGGGLIAGVLDAIDGVIAYGAQGLNPIQVLQYIASGALGKSAFQGGLATAALGAAFHFGIAWVAAAVIRVGKPAVRDLENTCCACRTALRCSALLLHELPCAAAISGGDRRIPTGSTS